MNVLSWNVDGAFSPAATEEKIARQVDYLGALDPVPDVIMLQEVTTDRREFWREIVRSELGYDGIVDTLDWAAELRSSSVQPHDSIGHSNGHLTAVESSEHIRRKSLEVNDGDYEKEDVKDFVSIAPEKLLVAEYEYGDESIELWNVRAIPGSQYGQHKIEILETIFDRILNGGTKARILGGDLNTPDEELPDGQAVTHVLKKDPRIRRRWLNAEMNILKGLGHVGMVDVFRYLHGYGELGVADTSWKDNRFDHIFATETLSPVDCWYDHDGLEHSDHAPILAEFDI